MWSFWIQNFIPLYLTPFTQGLFLAAFPLCGWNTFLIVWDIHFKVSLASDLFSTGDILVTLGDPIICYRSFPQSVPGKEGAENKFPGPSFYGPYAHTPERVKAHASCTRECKLLELLWETALHYLLRLKTYIPYDPEISFLGLYSKKCVYTRTKRCVRECSSQHYLSQSTLETSMGECFLK